jgi:hypothetical protein
MASIQLKEVARRLQVALPSLAQALTVVQLRAFDVALPQRASA